MTYPPARHLLRDLAVSGTRAGDEIRNRAEHRPGLCDEKGRFRLGVMATIIDMSGAGLALAVVKPDWIATVDLNAHLIHPVTEGAVEVICRPLRLGQGRVVIDAEMRGTDGTLCGRGLMAFSRIPGSATTASIEESTGAGTTAFALDGGDPLDHESLLDRCGFEPVGPGQLVFSKTDYVKNSFGTVNGGVLALAAEAAAVSASGGGLTTDLQIHYLAQVGDGPVGVTAEVLRDDGRSRLCQTRIVDRADDRLVAVADVAVATDDA